MTRKNVLGEAVCDHCGKQMTTKGETVYMIATYVDTMKIGDDLDEHYVQSHEHDDEPKQTIESDLCYECYRDTEQVLQNGFNKKENSSSKQ